MSKAAAPQPPTLEEYAGRTPGFTDSLSVWMGAPLRIGGWGSHDVQSTYEYAAGPSAYHHLAH
jgi:hypothetical protein